MYRIRTSYTRISSSTPIGSNICRFVPRGRWPLKYPKTLGSTQDTPYRSFKLDKVFPDCFTLRSDRLHSVWEINAMKFPPRAMHEFLNGRLGHSGIPGNFSWRCLILGPCVVFVYNSELCFSWLLNMATGFSSRWTLAMATGPSPIFQSGFSYYGATFLRRIHH